jgi:hypothetical protein
LVTAATRPGGAFAELAGKDREGGLLAAGCDVVGMVLDRVVQQGSACDVGVGDPVVAEDTDRDPQRMAGVRLALPPVAFVQPRHPRQRGADAVAVYGREPIGLDQQPLAQAVLPVHGGDRVQAHHRQQSPLRRIHPDGLAGSRIHGVVCCHGLTFPDRGLAAIGDGRLCVYESGDLSRFRPWRRLVAIASAWRVEGRPSKKLPVRGRITPNIHFFSACKMS